MKRVLQISILPLLALLMFTACGEASAEESYICPMRCEGSASTKPGKCPACKMDLVTVAELEESEGREEGNVDEGHDHSGHDHSDHEGHDHSGHDHDHEGHDHAH